MLDINRDNSSRLITNSYIGVIFLIVMLGIIGINHLNTQNNLITKSINTQFLLNNTLQEFRNISITRGILMIEMLKENDAFELDELIQNYHLQAGKFLAKREYLNQIELPPHQLKILNEGLKAASAIYTDQLNAIELISNGKQSEAKSLYDEKIFPVKKQIQQSYDDFIAAMQTLAENEIQAAQNRSFKIIAFNVALLIIIFLLAIVIGIIFYRSSSRYNRLLLNEKKTLEEKVIQRTRAIEKAMDQLSQQQLAMDEHSIIAVTDTTGTITSINEKFCQISGYSEEELLGKNHRMLNSANQPKSYWTNMYRTIANGKVWSDDVRNISKHGEYYWVNTTIIPFLDADGKPESYVSIRTDITRQKNIEEQLVKTNNDLMNLSRTDPLTGIANRRAYEETLSSEVNSAKRTGNPLSLLLIDIDYFKLYNDNYGHEPGDVTLRRVAKILKTSLPRKTDFVARFGGEEFVVLLPATEIVGALEIAERLRLNVQNMAIDHAFSETLKIVTISIGIACLSKESLNEIDLLQEADAALYEAKKNGRNRSEVYVDSKT